MDARQSPGWSAVGTAWLSTGKALKSCRWDFAPTGKGSSGRRQGVSPTWTSERGEPGGAQGLLVSSAVVPANVPPLLTAHAG